MTPEQIILTSYLVNLSALADDEVLALGNVVLAEGPFVPQVNRSFASARELALIEPDGRYRPELGRAMMIEIERRFTAKAAAQEVARG